ncbi:MAG: hypothetical protein ACR65R_12490 [Methylomicrobium sp.]
MHRYLTHLLASTFFLLATTAALNWFVNPYAIFDSPQWPGINEAKPALLTNWRIYKLVGYVHRPMDALILGTSRAHAGLSPKHQAFNGLRTLNLAIPGQPYEETQSIFKYAVEHNSLKMVVVGLDFFASNAYHSLSPDSTPDNFAIDRKQKLLFSFDTLVASSKTLFQPGTFPLAPDMAIIDNREKYSKQAFLKSEEGYMWGGGYLPGPKCMFRFETEPTETGKINKTPPLENIRATIALAHQHNVKLYLFISPSHARQWEVLATLGLWDTWEAWKRKLVQINEEEAERAHEKPFPLWDFSGYNSITAENLPERETADAVMVGYIESSHYKPAIGNLLLDRIFNLNVPGRTIPEDFGVLLTQNGIEQHLEAIRSARMRYRQAHPQDVAEIAALEIEVKQQNRCIDYTHAVPEPVTATGGAGTGKVAI